VSRFTSRFQNNWGFSSFVSKW